MGDFVANDIFLTQKYGKIRLHLHEKMDESGINRNQMAKLVGSRFEVIDKWYKNEVERLDLDILARICYVLGCEVQDILEYEKIVISEKS